MAFVWPCAFPDALGVVEKGARTTTSFSKVHLNRVETNFTSRPNVPKFVDEPRAVVDTYSESSHTRNRSRAAMRYLA